MPDRKAGCWPETQWKEPERRITMQIEVPKGAALVVFVGEDGNIIEAVDPGKKPLKFESKAKDPFTGSKFAVAGQSAAAATDVTAQAATIYCCWRLINGYWRCRPEYC
jgi:hypothetical protein